MSDCVRFDTDIVDAMASGGWETLFSVSAMRLPKYLGEFEYRWNMRHVPHLMLDRLLYSFVRQETFLDC